MLTREVYFVSFVLNFDTTTMLMLCHCSGTVLAKNISSEIAAASHHGRLFSVLEFSHVWFLDNPRCVCGAQAMPSMRLCWYFEIQKPKTETQNGGHIQNRTRLCWIFGVFLFFRSFRFSFLRFFLIRSRLDDIQTFQPKHPRAIFLSACWTSSPLSLVIFVVLALHIVRAVVSVCGFFSWLIVVRFVAADIVDHCFRCWARFPSFITFVLCHALSQRLLSQFLLMYVCYYYNCLEFWVLLCHFCFRFKFLFRRQCTFVATTVIQFRQSNLCYGFGCLFIDSVQRQRTGRNFLFWLRRSTSTFTFWSKPSGALAYHCVNEYNESTWNCLQSARKTAREGRKNSVNNSWLFWRTAYFKEFEQFWTNPTKLEVRNLSKLIWKIRKKFSRSSDRTQITVGQAIVRIPSLNKF